MQHCRYDIIFEVIAEHGGCKDPTRDHSTFAIKPARRPLNATSCSFCRLFFFPLRCSRAARGRAETDHQCASCPFSAAPGTGMHPTPICQLPDSTISGILNRRHDSTSPTTGQLGLSFMWLTNTPIHGPTARAVLWMNHSELTMVLGGAKWATAPRRHILVCWQLICFCPCLGFCFCLFLLFCPFFVYIRGSPIF